MARHYGLRDAYPIDLPWYFAYAFPWYHKLHRYVVPLKTTLHISGTYTRYCIASCRAVSLLHKSDSRKYPLSQPLFHPPFGFEPVKSCCVDVKQFVSMPAICAAPARLRRAAVSYTPLAHPTRYHAVIHGGASIATTN